VELRELRRGRLRLLGEVLDERALLGVELRRGDDLHADPQVAAGAAAQRRDAAALDRQDVAGLHAGAPRGRRRRRAR
jgi:hypothetical protein